MPPWQPRSYVRATVYVTKSGHKSLVSCFGYVYSRFRAGVRSSADGVLMRGLESPPMKMEFT